MIIVFTLSPFGLIKFDVEKQKILKIYSPRSERIYGLTIHPENGNYIVGFTDEIRLLDSDFNLVGSFSELPMNDLHSVEFTAANRILMTCAKSDQILVMDDKMEGLEIITKRIRLMDYLTPPDWWGNLPDPSWRLTNKRTARHWLHVNYAFKHEGLYYGTAFHQLGNKVNGEISQLNDGFVFVLDVEQKRVRWTFGQSILKWRHCILPLGNDVFLVADSGNDRLVQFRHLENNSFDLIKYYDINARVHHLEPISPTEFLLTDCNREDPRILLFNIETGSRELVWEPDDEMKAFANEQDEQVLQPYVVRRIG